MARTKPPTTMRREPSDVHKQFNGQIHQDGYSEKADPMNGISKDSLHGAAQPLAQAQRSQSSAGLTALIICVGGIYASFLSWAFFQERLTTTNYGTASHPQRWTYSLVLNTLQSILAATTGYIYLYTSTTHPHHPRRPLPIFPGRRILLPLGLIAATTALASPFGYASLKYVDYITFILAKSCKLLPVMALHVSVFRKRYPLYKYAVVAAVTLGVAVFTLHHPSTSKKAAAKKGAQGGNSAWGLLLLSVNLLFDGITNSTQDHIFTAFKPFSGPQMMCAQNIMSTAMTGAYLLLAPYLALTGAGQWLGMGRGAELADALAFVKAHPQAGWDAVTFAACGAVGQVFIFYTLAHFSSLLLVTVTVTRKMLTMVLSVVWFGHRITGMQWLGVGLVFGGIGAEAVITRREKAAKERARKAAKSE